MTFQRVTTGSLFIPQLDGLRFVAILSVVLFHLHASLSHNGAVISPLAKFDLVGVLAKRGVELFFAISGFILAMPFVKTRLYGHKPVVLRDYFVRRLTRLEPPYLLNILICFAAVVWGGAAMPETLAHLLSTLLYVHIPAFHTFSPINIVTWSLEVEVQFYILVPLLTTLFCITRNTFRRAILVATILTWSVVTLRFGNTAAMLSILYYLPFFLAGFLVCDFYLQYGNEWEANRSFRWDLVGLAWPLVWILGQRAGHLVLPFVVVLLYIGAFRGRILSLLFSQRWITSIGGMCYTIYLFHFLIISTCGRITKRLYLGGGFAGYFVLQAALILPVVLAFCAIYYLLVERPCMDKMWPRKLAAAFWKRPTGIDAVATSTPSST